jgi:hypothetical protein
MKVVCISSPKPFIANVLTINKIYEVIEEYRDNYLILDDLDSETIYKKSRFISLDLHRENLIEEIIK